MLFLSLSPPIVLNHGADQLDPGLQHQGPLKLLVSNSRRRGPLLSLIRTLRISFVEQQGHRGFDRLPFVHTKQLGQTRGSVFIADQQPPLGSRMYASPHPELKQSLATYLFPEEGWLYTMLVHLLSSERGIDLLRREITDLPQ